jgi:D-lactate dehydrogenase
MVKGAMKIVFFSAQGIETSYLERNPEIFAGIELSFVSRRLSGETVELARGAYAVCVFVNDVLDRAVLEKLCQCDIRLVLLRCAGYNVRLSAPREPLWSTRFPTRNNLYRTCRLSLRASACEGARR